MDAPRFADCVRSKASALLMPLEWAEDDSPPLSDLTLIELHAMLRAHRATRISFTETWYAALAYKLLLQYIQGQAYLYKHSVAGLNFFLVPSESLLKTIVNKGIVTIHLHSYLFLFVHSSLSSKTSRLPTNALAQPQISSDSFALNVSPFMRGGSFRRSGGSERSSYRRARSNLFDLKDPNEVFPTLPVYTAGTVTPDSADSSSPGTQATLPSVLPVAVSSTSASGPASGPTGAPLQSASPSHAPSGDHNDGRAAVRESEPNPSGAQTKSQLHPQQSPSVSAVESSQKKVLVYTRPPRSQDPSRAPVTDLQLAMRSVPAEKTASTSSSSTSSPSLSLRIVAPAQSSEPLPILPSSPLASNLNQSVLSQPATGDLYADPNGASPQQSGNFVRGAPAHLSERLPPRGHARAASLVRLDELPARSAATNGPEPNQIRSPITFSSVNAQSKQSPFFSWPLPPEFVSALQNVDASPPLSPLSSSSSSAFASRNSVESSGEQQVRHPQRGGPSSDELDRLISGVYSLEVQHLAEEGSLHAYLTSATSTPKMKRHPTEARKLGELRGLTRTGVRLNVRSLPYYATALQYRDPVSAVPVRPAASGRAYPYPCACVEWEGLSLAAHLERALRVESELQSADSKLPLCLREVLKEQALLRQAAPPTASVHRENLVQHKRDLAALEFHRQSLEVRPLHVMLAYNSEASCLSFHAGALLKLFTCTKFIPDGSAFSTQLPVSLTGNFFCLHSSFVFVSFSLLNSMAHS